MIAYLGLNKKKGYENCAILKNSWIALVLQSRDAKKWSEEMKKLDNLGDEIALYMLCKMYHRHCFVFTKVKSWCTIDNDIDLDEEAMLDKCDIILLFIELGVFGELKSWPYAPPPRHVYIQETTADIPSTSTNFSTDNINSNSALDLRSVDTAKSSNSAISDNTNNSSHIEVQNVDTAAEDSGKETSFKPPVMPHTTTADNDDSTQDDTNQGVTDHVNTVDLADSSSTPVGPPHIPPTHSPKGKPLLSGPVPNDGVTLSSLLQPLTMLRCVVNLTCLTEDELCGISTHAILETEVIGGYNMRKCHVTEPRLDRFAKYNIKYCSSSDYSSDKSYGK